MINNNHNPQTISDTVSQERGIFENATILDALFWRRALDGSEFIGATIFRSSFAKASMENTLYKKCNIRETDFIKTNFRNAVFNNSTIGYCDYSLADLSGARFILNDEETHGLLTTCVFDHAKMKGATINGTSLYLQLLKYKNK